MLTSFYNPIPQNNSTNFVIIKGDWNYAIDIKFRQQESLNMINLYAILKSYIIKEEHAVKFIFTISQIDQNEKKIFTYTKIPLNKLKKLDFLDFLDYYHLILDKDYEYISTHEFYGFRILFYSESIFWRNNLLYPIFPWNQFIQQNFIINNLKYENQNQSDLIKKITILKKKNIFLRKKILFLKKYSKWKILLK